MLFLSVDHLPSSVPASVDGIELRLDLFYSWTHLQIDGFIKKSLKPVMLTLKSRPHGGGYSGSKEEKETTLKSLLLLKPAFCDIEYDMRKEFIEEVIQDNPHTKFILSYHNLEKTPDDLEKVYGTMKKISAYGYKIASIVFSTNDALSLLLFSKERKDLSVICMGEKGSFARALGPVAGNLIDYASLENSKQTAPGQLSLNELINVYRYPTLSPSTALYGLIGDPVEQSSGHIYHNDVFAKKNCDAVYVKMIVKQDELSSFLTLAQKMGFKGLSVTMPLKEEMAQLVEPFEKDLCAVNSLLFEKNKIKSTNTDGKGALDAIEKRMSVQGKKVVLIGAGGACQAIAFEAKKRGAILWILNRTRERAEKVAQKVGCFFGNLNDIPDEYDILINGSLDPSLVDLSGITPLTIVMDVVHHPQKTPFLEKARALKAQVIYGEEMFLNQAAGQTTFWLKEQVL